VGWKVGAVTGVADMGGGADVGGTDMGGTEAGGRAPYGDGGCEA